MDSRPNDRGLNLRDIFGFGRRQDRPTFRSSASSGEAHDLNLSDNTPSGLRADRFVSSGEACDLILSGGAPSGLLTDRIAISRHSGPVVLPPQLAVGHLLVEECPGFAALPECLFAEEVDIRRCRNFSCMPATAWARSLNIESCDALVSIPEGMRLERVVFTSCAGLKRLPQKLRCSFLSLRSSRMSELPASLNVEGTVDLSRSTALVRLPNMRTSEIVLRGCTALRSLPDELDCHLLDLSGCTALRSLPDELDCHLLDLSGCTALRWQEFALVSVDRLVLSDCVTMTSLPEWIMVSESIDLANTGLTSIPESLRQCGLLWRGVPIDEKIAFRPWEITADAVAKERNSERRRVLLERMGLEKFLMQARHTVLDSDDDPGGERKLLRCAMDDEDIVALVVSCPSTGRRYFIRVPPNTTCCRHAAAWIAGFDDPREYVPIVET